MEKFEGEKLIEKHLRVKAKKRGGLALKFVSPGLVGVPDRIVLFPGGRVAFAEIKGNGGKATELQKRRLEMLREFGFVAKVIASKEEADKLLEEMCK